MESRGYAGRESDPPAPENPDAEAALERLGEGEALDGTTRARMERSLGTGLDGVRVHRDGGGAAEASRQNALAVAVGGHVAFAPGAYRPGTLAGDALLAHELAHTVQQRSPGAASERALESHADAAAAAALLGRSAAAGPGAGLRLQRCDPKRDPAPSADRPADTLTLPTPMVDGLQTAWDDSFPGGTSKEQGGILVKKADGTHEWRAGTKSTGSAFTPNVEDLKPGETLVSIGHTHPYDASEGGHTDVGPSRDDISTMIDFGEQMTVVRSGDTTFSIVRTKEFDAMVAGKSKTDIEKLQKEMNKTYGDAMTGATGSFPERVEAGVKAVCAKYKLLYYKGKGATLDRVE